MKQEVSEHSLCLFSSEHFFLVLPWFCGVFSSLYSRSIGPVQRVNASPQPETSSSSNAYSLGTEALAKSKVIDIRGINDYDHGCSVDGTCFRSVVGYSARITKRMQ